MKKLKWETIEALSDKLKQLQQNFGSDFQVLMDVSSKGLKLREIGFEMKDDEGQIVSDESFVITDDKIKSLKSRLKEVNYMG